MTTRTTIRSWPAMGLAALFVAGTSFVLFNDLIDGAKLTTSHVLTALALIAATAAGHQIVTMFRAHRYGVALGMVVLTAAALAYVATMSGARNAEQAALKAERIEAANAQREEIRGHRAALMPERERSKAMLEAAQKAIATECATGEGTRCKGRRTTAEVYANALSGIDGKLAAIDARLETLGGPQTPNAGYKAAAEAIVLLPWFADRKPADVERALIVLLPWLAVLIAELGTIVFLSSALGHEHVPTVADRAQTSFAIDPPPPGPGKRRRHRQLPASETPRQLPANVIPIAGKRSDIVTALEAIGRPATVSELARQMGVTRGEASRRWREAGSRVTARRDGKFVVITLPEWGARAA